MISGLSEIADEYDAILCDVWGVIHNGVVANRETSEALQAFRASGKPVILITNAPRPNPPIQAQLARLGVPREAFDLIITSGDVTRTLLARAEARRVLHVGPERDLPLFDGLDLERVGDAQAELVVCTGLFDDETETPDDYRERFAALVEAGLELICANPDIVVDRGNTLIWCAGALARLYDELGGKTTIVGKPYAPVYVLAREQMTDLLGRPAETARLLAIGDGLPTDIRGAVGAGIDALFVTAGIHAEDFGPADAPDPERIAARLAEEGLTVRAAMPRLKW